MDLAASPEKHLAQDLAPDIIGSEDMTTDGILNGHQRDVHVDDS